MIQRINSDLSNDLGNLCQRTLSLIFKNFDGKIPDYPQNLTNDDNKIINFSDTLLEKLRIKIDNQELHLVIQLIWELISEANKYIDGQAPWSLANKNKDRMGEILAIMTEVIRNIAIFLQPIIPESANKILNQLKIPNNERTFNFSCGKYRLSKNITIEKPYPVFPRYFET